MNFRASEAKCVNLWPADPAVPCLISARGGNFLTVNEVPLHIVFHY